jgi:exodeoxyribonuclease VII large subunit
MPSPSQAPVLSVSQLTQAIKVQLEGSFPQVWIQGEVSNFRAQSSGHLYFSLKDAHAQISCVMFRGNAGKLARAPRDGDQVTVQGEINVYPPRGNYQLIVRSLELSGMGALLLRLEELKKELAARGWFDPARKQPLPNFPKRIGLITSPSGAAIQDMLNVLNRRFAGLHVLINPVRVQGAGAAEEIAQAIQQMNLQQLADVLVIGRGGGSIEDLWAFNEESVARAVFESQIPVISAVGHESDYCLADLVADVRAPTPSAAAELVVSEKTQHLQFLASSYQRLQQGLRQIIYRRREKLEQLRRQPVLESPYALLGMRMQKLDDWKGRIDSAITARRQQWALRLAALQCQHASLNPRRNIQQLRQRLQQIEAGIWNTTWKIKQRRERLEGLQQHLAAIDPQELLNKGYSILFSEKDASVISSLQALSSTPRLRIRLGDGEVLTTLTETEVTCRTPTKPQTT